MSAADSSTDLSKCLSDYEYLSLQTRGQLSEIVVSHPKFNARVLTQGAQMLSFCPTGDTDWLWLSPTAEFRKEVSVRGGIPICWPWFGDAAKNPDNVRQFIFPLQPPAHGLARLREWTLTQATESADQVQLTLSLTIKETKGWFSAATVSLEITMTADTLRLRLSTTALEDTLSLTQALHTYFPTSDIKKTQVQGLDGFTYTDALDEWKQKTQSGDVIFKEETDRVYQCPQSLSLVTPEHTATLSSNSKSCIVWNPWRKKSKKLSQFPDKAYLKMFCVETANALDDAVTLQKDETATLEMTLTRR